MLLCLELYQYKSYPRTKEFDAFFTADGYRAYAHDVMAAILVFQNNEMAGMLVY